ncbi:hypothetical protein ACFQY0_14035 [Haloferula chungangensis]|uniref:Uncharacterized protein n=1 Tax=Haloferula chungangensis TaxID=1048331 RepID=A0ABW2LAY1_9BACT
MSSLSFASSIVSTLRWLPPLALSVPCAAQSPSFQISKPPNFVVAEMGVRHALMPSYSTIADWIHPESALGRSFRVTLVSAPDGLSLSDDGVLEWCPGTAEIGNSGVVELRVQVIQNALPIFEWTEHFSLQVLAGLPELADIPLQVNYERLPSGWNSTVFSGYQPTDRDRDQFEWSLIDPPAGVYIDSLGGIHWPDDRGYARSEPYRFGIRIDYRTPNGWLQDEVTLQVRILPQPAANNYGELRTSSIQTSESAMLGFSLAATDEWIAAGEPFPNTTHPGRVRLWKRNEQNDTWSNTFALQSDVFIEGDAFGTSLSLIPSRNNQPSKLAVGAPDSAQIGIHGETIVSVGAVHLYTTDSSNSWRKEATIPAPLTQQSLDFGYAVSMDDQTLVAGMPGRNAPGYDAGALAVYRLADKHWSWSQTLQAEVPAWGDRFGESVFLEEGWIAVGAPGNDRMANNAGAVHLFHEVGGEFIQQLQLHAPHAHPENHFGEVLLMSGPWLFVGSSREEDHRGYVHIYHRSDGVWSFHQTLLSPFAEAGSGFGTAISISDDVLAVSAPGYHFDRPEFDANHYPWKGITLFRLSGEHWEWERQVTESPDGSPPRHTWAYALAQIGEGRTVAGIPDLSPWADGEPIDQAGRLFLHRWPELIGDPFIDVLASLPAIDGRAAEADDDSNQDGIPNIIEWMMGSHPGAAPTFWELAVPASRKPFLRRNSHTDAWEFMIPQLIRGLNKTTFIEVSSNLSDWTPLKNVRWGALEDVYFPGKDGSRYHTYFHPVTLPHEAGGVSQNLFIRWGAH